MNEFTEEWKLFHPMEKDVVIPCYETFGSSGMDVRFYSPGDRVRFHPGNIKTFSTGLKVDIPQGYEIQVRPRSGLAFNHGITVLNSPGTIDSDYQHELKICLINHGAKSVWIEHGERIAQLVYAPVEQATGILIKKIGRKGGFGSTGRS